MARAHRGHPKGEERFLKTLAKLLLLPKMPERDGDVNGMPQPARKRPVRRVGTESICAMVGATGVMGKKKQPQAGKRWGCSGRHRVTCSAWPTWYPSCWFRRC